jgi:porphobilinogen synthase
MTGYPQIRLRRNRKHSWLREIISENNLLVKDLIQPFFIIEGENKSEAISTMPGISRLSIDLLCKEALKAESLGIKAIMLFPSINENLKTEQAEESFNDNNLICRAIKELKKHIKIGIMADVALDPYTISGHDGILTNMDVDNDATIEVLCKQALSLARAGCDVIAPSDMMDGRIGVIRTGLDQQNFSHIAILAYSAKFASNFYGPFRDAVRSKASLAGGNKFSYQMDFRNKDESIREIRLDIEEGADIIMIKPALAYLDIIHMAKEKFNIPIFAYQVSGEYSMLKLAAKENCLNYEKAMLESLISIKRAGASAIVTYAAMEVARMICKNTVL